MERRKILWLVSWYPNKLSPYNGDFIKRHAEAVSLYEDVQVIYVVRDLTGVITKNILIEESNKGGFAEKVIYYHSLITGVSLFDKYLSERKYRKLYKEAIRKYLVESGNPILTHVHVGMKSGAIANWLKEDKDIPYVVSEHWSGFFDDADDKITDQPFYIQSAWKKVITNSSGFSAVSKSLANALKKHFYLAVVNVIPNVVDTSIFHPVDRNIQAIRFVHISGLEELKNVTEIIKAFTIILKSYPSAMLDIVGPENTLLKQFIQSEELEKSILFHKEVPQQQLVEFVQQSTALILYSKYETFGCVIIEANACGIPVIVSDIPVFHETVTEGINGLFAAPNNPAALANKMMEIINNRSSFDNKAIAETTASRYNYETVGKQFSDWYSEILLKA